MKQCTVPVAMVFFNRPEQFKQIFEEVRKARPTKLFLIQDGARDNHPTDEAQIQACRQIAEKVDWECEVHRNYSDVNLGCGGRVSSGITWAFTYVDRLIIFEDDTLPSQSWFSFCEEILERFKSDERIGMITGVNHLGQYNKHKSSYFFATCGSIAGWATWKRVWDDYDYSLEDVDDDYLCAMLEKTYYPRWRTKQFMTLMKNLRRMAQTGTKRNSWSGPWGFMSWCNSRLIVIPNKNLITNIGLTPEATNGGTSTAILPKKLQSIFNANRYEMEFPLVHPKFVIEDRIYNDELQKVMTGGANPFSRAARRFESIIRIILVRYLHLLH